MKNDKRKNEQAAIQSKKAASKPQRSFEYSCGGAHPQCLPIADATVALKAAADLAAESESPDKKFKLPKISDKKAGELTQAAKFAYGNDEADKFFDDAMARAIAKRERREAHDEQTKTNKPK
jgi:hypothetical protein